MDRGETIFVAVWAVGMVLTWPPWFWFSIRSRKVRGEPLIPRPPVGAVFCERKASGRAHDNLLGRASNCLMVAIRGDELWITPNFPFNMIAPYGFMGLEHRIDRRRVRAEALRTPFGRRVALNFTSADGKLRSLDLALRDPDGFLAALKRP